MKIPRDLSGAELIRAFSAFGYSPVRQTGSHVQLVTKQNGEHHITVPLHSPLRVGTLNAILKLVADHFNTTKNDVLERLK
ncbi:MAG TPA: type II toxin-antitoxin system HicA family toxin [Candidatus Kapabacteria bacterium]|nr:type II toxin-antitoxin system HicA family toxin [Candidatus Kapabacteria bacterium]